MIREIIFDLIRKRATNCCNRIGCLSLRIKNLNNTTSVCYTMLFVIIMYNRRGRFSVCSVITNNEISQCLSKVNIILNAQVPKPTVGLIINIIFDT